MEILEVLALWFCISVPMVFLGAYFGYRKPVEPYPVVTSNIPRQVRVCLDPPNPMTFQKREFRPR